MRRAESEWVFLGETGQGITVRNLRLKAYPDHSVGKVLPLPIVQRLAGHPEISTTMRYIHLNDDDVRAAMAKEREGK